MQGVDAVVVGGGNSAGQAAVYLAMQVRKVYLVVRGDSLYKDMSSYLARRIEQNPQIEVLLDTEVRQMGGHGRLSWIEVVNNKSGEVRKLESPGPLQLHRGRAPVRLAPAGHREGREGFRPHRPGGGAVAPLGRGAGAVPIGDQSRRRLRRRRRAVRID